MIGGAKGIGIGIDFGIPNQYCRATSKPYIEKDVLDSLRVVASAYGKSNNDADRSIVKNLVDASNPFIISNTAFKLNSGFGKYEVDFNSLDRTDQSVLTTDYKFIKISKIKQESDGNVVYSWGKSLPAIDSVKIRVRGLDEVGARLTFTYLDDSDQYVRKTYYSDGTYDLPSSSAHEGVFATNFRFAIFGYKGDCNITIEQIPSFEGAFVTDGVNDMITSTKTVQEMLGGSNKITVVSMIHQVKDSVNNVSFTNYIRGSANGYFRNIVNNYDKTGIYGYTSSDLIGLSVVNNILGDKNDYTANGDNRDSIINGNFSVQGYSYNDGNNTGDFSSVAWYWTIIANKVLTTDQINQVIAYYNLDRTLKPDILCNTIKQGITNENHAEFGDKLIDFSGNGRDIQLNNLAWKGDSGIGKYEVDFTTWTRGHFTDEVNFTPSKIEVTGILATSSILINNNSTPIYKVDIYNPNKSVTVYFQYNNGTDITRISLVDGINELPSGVNSIFVTSDRLNSKGITITQIPSNAGALCLDGVNDFGKVTGMPIYKDYTFIIDYERISYTSEGWGGAIVSKSPSANNGAFISMMANSAGTNKQLFSFGGVTAFIKDDLSRILFWQTKYKSENTELTVGEGVDGDTLWLGTLRDNDSRFFNGAIYSLMSFPYSMSEFLIERQLKKHKLGTLYPDMVEFRPVIKANANYKITYYQIDSTNTWKSIKVGDYIVIGAKLAFQITFDNDASELKEVVSPQLSGIIVEKRPSNPGYNIYSYITSKSPQKINITIDEYIRFEDIVQPYPVLLRFKDENGNEVSWGGKFRVGSTITRIGSIADPESNLLNGLYSISGLSLNGKAVTSSTSIVEKQMVFRTTATWLLDNNEPKVILSPRLLRIPNSSYKILGHIPDISGHGNHGKINNSAYAEGSGVNEDGSYQFDGVDDFVTIPTLSSGGKQVLMKVNWQNDYDVPGYMYDSNIGEYRNYIIKGNKKQIAYENASKTYIDGIQNSNITSGDLKDITHNITSQFNVASGTSYIGCRYSLENFLKMSLYDFMLFDEISTDDKIKELNKYVGIEGNVWGILTQLSNSTLISNETLIKNE